MVIDSAGIDFENGATRRRAGPSSHRECVFEFAIPYAMQTGG
jgi:hypothetical protein